jgi:hypothetical protein
MFFSKNAICCENVNNVFLRLVSKCEMWSRNAISNFLFCRKSFCEFILVIMLNHFIVYVSIVRFEFFRDDERSLIRFFEVTKSWLNDSSSLTKTTHQIWRKRFIKFDKQHFVKFDELYFIKFNEKHLIKFDERYVIKFNEWYFIKLDEWYFIKLDKWYLIRFDEDFVCFLK